MVRLLRHGPCVARKKCPGNAASGVCYRTVIRTTCAHHEYTIENHFSQYWAEPLRLRHNPVWLNRNVCQSGQLGLITAASSL
jgi:hypothetical protein